MNATDPHEDPRSGPEGRDTKDRILDVAEQLFGDLGYASTSLRAVTSQAEVNLAAVHYHFGSKIGLFEAVFQRRVNAVNDERLARLDALEAASKGELALEDLLQAFLEPAFCQAAAEDPTFVRFQRFIGRVMSETGEHVEAMRGVFREVQLRFFPAFHRALPHLTERDVFWRMHLLVGSMCNLMSDPTRISVLSGGRCDGSDPDESVRQLVAFAAGGLRGAPATRSAASRAPVRTAASSESTLSVSPDPNASHSANDEVTP